MKIKVLSVLLMLTVLVSAQSLKRPMIHVTADERAATLEKIEKYAWAKEALAELKKSADAHVAAHKTNPAATINAIIALAKDDNLSEAEVGSATNEHFKVLSRAAHAGMLYFLTENEDYAQYAADVIWHYFQELAPRTPETTAICGYYFFDPRSTYPHLAYAYDFVYNFLQKEGAQVYDKSAGKYIDFNNAIAQKAMKNVAGNALLESGGVDNRYGQMVSNHPILTAPGALAAILCIDDDAERERLFNVFWKTGTRRQNSFTKTIMPMFGEQGIWPESTSYGFMSRIQLVLNMVDRLKPELNVTAQYMNALEGVFLFENLRHPNRTFVRYGDSKRNNDGTKYLYSYVLSIAKRNAYTDLQDKAETALAQYYNANGGRSVKFSTSPYGGLDHLDLFWGEELPSGTVKAFDYKPTVVIKHAGVALQRNYTETNNKEYGLCGIIGGAHYVHSHVTGISMELYGSGDVMAANGGMPPSVADRKKPEHTNYFRLYAGNNTVIVNGTSHGRQSGSWTSGGYLWQNTTRNIAAEPAHLADPLSPNFSFATQYLDDNVNGCKQMRTLSTIRTSATTAYYFDMFRSKSNSTNNFHDYIYHNIGDATSLKDASNKDLALSATTRYQSDIGDPVKSPGWYFFENTMASAATDDPVNIRFHLQSRGRYMHMKTAGGTSYEYTKALGPNTREALNGYVKKKTQIVAVRKQGEAWNSPFTFVFEPTPSSTGSVKSVENLKSGSKVVGAVVTSVIGNKEIKDYIICNDASEIIEIPEYKIWFDGRFAIIRYEQNTLSATTTLYIGEGNRLAYKGKLLDGGADKKALLSIEGEPDVGRSLYFKSHQNDEVVPRGTDLMIEAFVGDDFVEASLWLNDTLNLGTKTKAPYVWENHPAIMNLEEEEYLFKLKAVDSVGTVETKSLTIRTPGQEPNTYDGNPHPVPGKIEFENYDLGGFGLAYVDSSEQNTSQYTYRGEDLVDLDVNGSIVADIEAGEWLEYTVDVAQSGTYKLQVNHNTTDFYGVEAFNLLNMQTGDTLIKDYRFIYTGRYVYYLDEVGQFYLSAGKQVLRFAMQNPYVNLDYMQFELLEASALQQSKEQSLKVYPNPSQGIFKVEMAEASTFTVYNVLGKAVQAGVADGAFLVDLSTQKEAVYILAVKTRQGTMTQQIIKK